MLIIWILVGSALLFVLQRTIYSRCWDEKLNVTFRFSSRAVTEGESAELIERCENRKLLPLPTLGCSYSVKRNFTAPTELAEKPLTLRRKFAVPWRSAVTNRAKINGLVRGVYSINDVVLTGSDLFRTANLQWHTSSDSRLIVYPAKIPAQKLALAARLLMGSVTTRRMTQEDPFALKTIRQYEIFDSPRLINWKASARTGELKVNQFENTTDEVLLFILDMGAGEVDAREKLIRLASSLSMLFLRRGVSVSMMANCRNCITGRQISIRSGAVAGHQTAIDESLARINLALPVTAPFSEFLAAIPHASLDSAIPVVLSADTTDGALRAFRAVESRYGGHFLSVNSEGRVWTQDGITLINSGAAESEARL